MRLSYSALGLALSVCLLSANAAFAAPNSPDPVTALKCKPAEISGFLKVLEKQIKHKVEALNNTTTQTFSGARSTDNYTLTTTTSYVVVPRLKVQYSSAGSKLDAGFSDFFPSDAELIASNASGAVSITLQSDSNQYKNPCQPVNATIKIAGSIRVLQRTDKKLADAVKVQSSTVKNVTTPLTGADIVLLNIPQILN